MNSAAKSMHHTTTNGARKRVCCKRSTPKNPMIPSSGMSGAITRGLLRRRILFELPLFTGGRGWAARLYRRPLHLAKHRAQCIDSPRYVLFHANRNPNVAIAARIGRAIAQEHATLPHTRAQLLMTQADVHQHEVRCTRPCTHIELTQSREDTFAPLMHLRDVPVEIVSISQRLRQHREREAVDVVRRADFVQEADEPWIRE